MTSEAKPSELSVSEGGLRGGMEGPEKEAECGDVQDAAIEETGWDPGKGEDRLRIWRLSCYWQVMDRGGKLGETRGYGIRHKDSGGE